MPSKNYWINRANDRMDDYILQAEETSDEIARAYYKASKKIEEEMVRVVKGLGAISDDKTALKYLLNPQSKSVIKAVKNAVNMMPEGPEKDEALTLISSPAYLFRMRRLQAVIDNTRKECNKLYKTELKDTTAHLKRLYSDAFSHTMYDIDQGYNALHTFSLFPASRVNTLLKNKWSGENYSARIWNSTQNLADSLKEQLLVSFMTGASVAKTAAVIREQFQVSAHAARRLVRTETNYIANQAEHDAYKRLGIEEYQFIATLDTRTSKPCRELDGRVFNVEDGKPGINMPPMHPNCRSTTIMYDADFPIKSRAARDADGNLIKVPGNMKYADWLKEYHPELAEHMKAASKNSGSFMSRTSYIAHSKLTDNFIEMNNGQKDVIRFRNIEKALNKSEIGQDYLKYLEDNPTKVYIYYNVDVAENLMGEYNSYDDRINIYASNTKTVELTAETLIHELTHKRYKIGGDWHAEAFCKAQELKHRLRKNKLTISEIRGIIEETKGAYTEDYWKWRDR